MACMYIVSVDQYQQQDNPGDYRGFLAKGVLLKTQQRAGDAERMFLQARFLAPPDARVLVDKLAAQ